MPNETLMHDNRTEFLTVKKLLGKLFIEIKHLWFDVS